MVLYPNNNFSYSGRSPDTINCPTNLRTSQGINPLPSRYIEDDKKGKFRGEEEYSERKKKKHKYSDKFA